MQSCELTVFRLCGIFQVGILTLLDRKVGNEFKFEANMRSEVVSSFVGQFYKMNSGAAGWPGVLELTETGASLKLLFSETSAHQELGDFGNELCLDLIGVTHEAGILTLFDCLRSGYSHKSGVDQITFKPTVIWKGSAPLSLDENFHSVSCTVQGLHRVIGTISGFNSVASPDGSSAAQLSEMFHLHGKEPHSVLLPKENATVSFTSRVKKESSTQHGVSLSTSDLFTVLANGVMGGRELLALAWKIESFLSFVCLDSVRSTKIELCASADPHDPGWELLWQLGRKAPSHDVYAHCCLCTCVPDQMEFMNALVGWTSASYTQNLARWLFLDAAKASVISPSRLVTLFQAVELIGNEGARPSPFEPSIFKTAAKQAASLLAQSIAHEEAQEPLRSRFYQLITSNNRPSACDLLGVFLSGIPEDVRKVLLPDEDQFTRDLVRLRNIFVHMRSSDLTLEQAQRMTGGFTYRLMALVAAHQATALGIRSSTYRWGLLNSAIGRSAVYYIADN